MLVQKSDKNVYLNVLINNPISSRQIIPAQLQTTLRAPIVDVPLEYNLIVTRFSIPATTIPLFIFRPQPKPNEDVNLGIYSIGFEYQGQNTPPIYLRWLGHNFEPAPPTPLPGENINAPYYFNFFYQNMADMVNNAFREGIAYAQANFSWPVFDVYMTYTANSGYFNLTGTQNMFSSPDKNDPNNIRIWMNTPLNRCFQGLKSYFRGVNAPDGRDKFFLIQNTLNNSPSTQDGFNPNIPAGYYQMPMEFNSDANLQTLSRIIITTNGLGGVVSQAEVSTGIQSGTYANILTDLVPAASSSNGSYNKYQYFVQSEFYRRSLTQLNPLTEIQLSFYWQADYGAEFNQLTLGPGDSLNVQMCFEAKNL